MSNPNTYYAHATDTMGNQVELPVNAEGTVQVLNKQRIKSLSTNAVKVFCRNNELEVLEAPDAIVVACNNNALTSLRLPNAEDVNCSENKLKTLSAPKATFVRCDTNQLTELTLESVVELECCINPLISLHAPNLLKVDFVKPTTSLYAPNLRKADDDIPSTSQEKPIEEVKEIEIELKNHFQPKNISSYDIDTLEVEIILDLHKELVVGDISFVVELQEVNFFSYQDESDIDAFSINLMRLNDKFGQHKSIVEQMSELPLVVNRPCNFKFSIPIASSPGKYKNLLDIIKQAPDDILEQEEELVLHITCYLNPGKGDEKYYYRMFAVANPFYKNPFERFLANKRKSEDQP